MEKIYITNTTRVDFAQHMHYKSPKVVEVPAYALNIEVTFSCKEELDLFYKLCETKISNGELIIGKTNSSKAEKENEKLEGKEGKEKEKRIGSADQEFNDGVKSQLGDQGARVELDTKKPRKQGK